MASSKSQPQKPLFKCWFFWVCLLAPITIALWLIYEAACNGSGCLSWDPSIVGFKYFFDGFKLPIGIAGISVPLTAMYIAHHRSVHQEQTLIAQGEQNRRSNYFDSYNYFEKSFNEMLNKMDNKTKGEALDLFETPQKIFSMLVDVDRDVKNFHMSASKALKEYSAIINEIRKNKVSLPTTREGSEAIKSQGVESIFHLLRFLQYHRIVNYHKWLHLESKQVGPLVVELNKFIHNQMLILFSIDVPILDINTFNAVMPRDARKILLGDVMMVSAGKKG